VGPAGLEVKGRSWLLGLMAVLLPIAAYLAAYHPGAAALVAVAGLALAVSPAFKWLRFKVERRTSSAPAPELLALPLVIEARVFVGPLATAALLVVIAVYLATVKAERSRPPTIIIVGVGVLFALPFSRPVDGSLVFGAVIPALCVTVLLMSAHRRDLHTAVSSLIDGIGIYILVNVAAYVAGVSSPAAVGRIGGLESSGGGTRVIFPFAGSLATPPTMAAIYVAAGIICFERCSPARRIFRFVSLTLAVFVLLAADTRTALVVAVVVLLLTITSTRVLARLAIPVTVASAAFGFIFGSLQALVGVVLDTLVSTVPQLSRSGASSDDLLTLNFRSEIWDRGLKFWMADVDTTGHLVGFGIRGQEQSGASVLYAREIGAITSNPLSASLHNSYIQTLYDSGVVGLAALIALLVWGTRRYAQLLRRGHPGSQLALPALLAVVVAGITEATLAPGYAQAPVFIAVGLVMFASAQRPASRASGASEREVGSVDGWGDTGRRKSLGRVDRA
jgi:O-antigen ligase